MPDDFYLEHVKSRMLAAFHFLSELVNQLITMKLEARADYPFKPDGKPVSLRQQGYKSLQRQYHRPTTN